METTEVSQKPIDNHDLLQGCIIGALCGDAIGAYLEFMRVYKEDAVKKALTLPGGGAHKIGKGQVTDDSELLICLGHGLVESKGVLNLDNIAKWYGKWVESKPFDMGRTTRIALTRAVGLESDQAKAVRVGARISLESESNGALMRISPMCIWCRKLSKEDLIKAVTQETKLTHSNTNAIHVSIAYVYTIQHLLNNRGDSEGAFKKCKDIVIELGNQDLLSWIHEVEEEDLADVHVASGWVRHAFSYALYYMKNKKSYLEAIEDMISRKGDTDTNACIVGAMLGALHGFDKLPKRIVKRVLEFDPEEEEGRMRPEFLVPGKQIKRIIEELIKIAPETLEIVAGETEEERSKKN